MKAILFINGIFVQKSKHFLQKHYDYINNLGYDVLYIAIQGSPNYNLDILYDESNKSIVLYTAIIKDG